MDDGSNEYEQIEPQQQRPSRLDNLAEGIYNYRESRNQKDIDAIKNRQKNEPVNHFLSVLILFLLWTVPDFS